MKAITWDALFIRKIKFTKFVFFFHQKYLSEDEMIVMSSRRAVNLRIAVIVSRETNISFL